MARRIEKKEPRPLSVQSLRVDALTLDKRNARKHDKRNIATIKESLLRFGQQKPIVVDSDGVVRAGNGTLEASRQLGWETIQAVVSDLTGSELTAYSIADNRTTDLSAFDDAILSEALDELRKQDEAILEAVGYGTDIDGSAAHNVDRIIGDAGVSPDGKLVSIDVPKKPPRMAWVLLGIPLVRFAEIAGDVERLAEIVEVCETIQNE